MDIFKLMGSEIARLPKEWDGKHFPTYLKGIFDEFNKKLDDLDSNDDLTLEVINNKDFIKKLADTIFESINLHYEGKSFKASNLLIKFFEDSKSLEKLCISTDIMDDDCKNRLYRLRVIKNFQRFYQKDFFHVPFDQRHKLNSYRYSILGQPALYLGSSAYVCWEELGRPPFSEVYSSRFEISEKMNILDISYSPALMAKANDGSYTKDSCGHNWINEIKEATKRQLLFWPLIAACSIEVFYKEAVFKPEYIIPQILMQIVHNSDNIDGIRYFSTKVDPQNIPYLSANWVFPVKTSLKSGACSELQKKFKMTEYMLWALNESLGSKLHLPEKLKIVWLHIDSTKTQYDLSSFGNVEKFHLIEQDACKISILDKQQ